MIVFLMSPWKEAPSVLVPFFHQEKRGSSKTTRGNFPQKKIREENFGWRNVIFVFTLPDTDIAPEKGWLEYYFPFGKDYFQPGAMLVSGRVDIFGISFHAMMTPSP